MHDATTAKEPERELQRLQTLYLSFQKRRVGFFELATLENRLAFILTLR